MSVFRIIRRIAAALLFVALVSTAALVLARRAPGDYTDTLRAARMSADAIERERARFHLDRSLPELAGLWLAGLARFDLGNSFRFDRPVRSLIIERAPRTLALVSSALLLAIAGGIAWGTVIILGRPLTRAALSGAATVLLSLPSIVVLFVFMLIAVRSGWLAQDLHSTVIPALGIAALSFGALLPDWLDPIMGRVVGLTLVGLGAWVVYSVYRYARGGESFRLRSRWMLVFDGVRYGWRRLQARVHGHEHVEPLEMSSYGARTAFGVGMIHGIGAETGTQVLLIAAVGNAASAGLGIPMLLAFVVGLLISNFAIVVVSSVGFVASQARERIYVVVGRVAGLFSLVLGLLYLFGLDAIVPEMDSVLPF